MRALASIAVAAAVVIGSRGAEPSFPGDFVRRPVVARAVAERDCLSLGDDMFDSTVAAIGHCRPLGLRRAGQAGRREWVYGTYERRWLLPPGDTVTEHEAIAFSRPISGGGSIQLQPVWHYRYEPQMLASVTPEVAPTADGATLLSINECVNGTGGCSQSFAIVGRGQPTIVKLAFIDSLNRRFPGAILHGFHVDVRTLRGSVALYSRNDANCCPSTIGDFSLRLRGASLELVTLKLRHPN
jgi:hypothetical protein